MIRIKNLELRIKNSIKGFTLIELLIVIAIIGVLSTLLMANFIGVRQRARDAQRKSDLRQIQAALEIYRSDVGGYPAAGTGNGQFSITTCGTGVKLSIGTAPNETIYMGTIPCDPSGSSISFNNGNYYYALNGAGYILASCIENTADTGQGIGARPSGIIPGACSGKYLVLTNP